MKKLATMNFILFICAILFSSPAYTPNHRHRDMIIHTESARADSATGFDVLHYSISMAIDDVNESVVGSVIATVQAEEIISEISYEMTAMNVDAILVNGNAAAYDYTNDLITIQLGTMNPGDIFTTQVDYSGFPTWDGLGMFFAPNRVFTISDPNASRHWWPCYDHPWDKATVDLQITVRDDWLVASNGLRTAIVDNGNGSMTHFWESADPLATYLVSLVCQIFVELLDEYEDIPIQNFVPSGMATNAQEDFSNLPFMMDVFSQKYGYYPFEKYGNAVTNFATYSAMEHQTMTTLGAQNINGNHGGEMVIAHELAHQWYGNSLTPLTWADVWLSEGFATYSEAVYMQAWQGFDAMITYVQASIQNYYKNWAGNTAYIIYDPPNPNMYFTPVTYEKAASVLHMIRLRVGDDVFYDILQTYYLDYLNSNVITSEFQEVCEIVSGLDFEQFFLQWVYSGGLPSYDYTYFFNPTLAVPRLMTYVQTSSTSGTDFYLDIPVRIFGPAGVDSVLVQGSPDAPLETICITTITECDDAEFDPNSWVLSRSKNFRGASINNAYAADGRVIVFWEEFWPEVGIDGYNLYRSDEPNGTFLQLNGELITETSFIDEDVINGTTYYYKLKAVKGNGYETAFSDVYEATPISFPLDQGILVIDETRDGNGTVGNPNDEMVDLFYEAVLPVDFTSWDYADQGSPDLDFMADFSTIIWHDDDLTEHFIQNNVNQLGCYLAAGGNLIISGWKTADEIPTYFKLDFLSTQSTQLISGWDFTGASSSIYPELEVDPDKLNPAFGGALPYVCIFPEAVNAIYDFEASGGSQHIGEACALKAQPEGTFVLLGFPLYFLEETEVSSFMAQILAEIGEVGTTNNVVSAGKPFLVNYPNPFNPSTTISFSFTTELTSLRNSSAWQAENTEVVIYNTKGQRVKVLHVILGGVEGSQVNVPRPSTSLRMTQAGSNEYSVLWNGTDDSGKQVASGIYFAKLKAGNTILSRKMLLMK